MNGFWITDATERAESLRRHVQHDEREALFCADGRAAQGEGMMQYVLALLPWAYRTIGQRDFEPHERLAIRKRLGLL